MTDDHWILTLYQRYVALYGDPDTPSRPLPLAEGLNRGEASPPGTIPLLPERPRPTS